MNVVVEQVYGSGIEQSLAKIESTRSTERCYEVCVPCILRSVSGAEGGLEANQQGYNCGSVRCDLQPIV